MSSLRRLVEGLADALGPATTPERLEAATRAALAASHETNLAPASPPRERFTSPLLEAAPPAVQSIALGLSLQAYSGRLPATIRARSYDAIRRAAGHHARLCEAAADAFGVALGQAPLILSPVGLLSDTASPTDLLKLARVLDAAGADAGVPLVSGFSVPAAHGLTRGGRALLEAVPEALATNERLCGMADCGSTEAGLNMEAVRLAARAAATLSLHTEGHGAARFAICCNAPSDTPFPPVAFQNPATPADSVHIGLCAAGVLHAAVQATAPDAELDHLTRTIVRAAHDLTAFGALIARWVSDRLATAGGRPVLPGAVFLCLAPANVGAPGLADILLEMGIAQLDAPGAQAAQALVFGAIQAGAHLAMPHVCLQRERPTCEAPLLLPGDTAERYLTALLLDAFAQPLATGRSAALRLAPIRGKQAGDLVDVGDGTGTRPVQPAPSLANSTFLDRPGRLLFSPR